MSDDTPADGPQDTLAQIASDVHNIKQYLAIIAVIFVLAIAGVCLFAFVGSSLLGY